MLHRIVFAGVLGLFAWATTARAETIFESYESSFGPWRANADMPMPWRVTRTDGVALDGGWSLDFTANGLADDGTVWMVREIELSPGTWDISLQFHISGSGGPIGAWHAIGFIGLFDPVFEEHFTQNSAGQDFGGIAEGDWVPYGMQRTISVSQPTTAYVAFGYNIVFEVFRTHYFDSVTVSGVPVQCGNGNCFAGENPCNCPADCGSPAGSETSCMNSLDDDCDQRFDCVDADCGGDPACAGIICDGDLVCEPGEDACACSFDCGNPPFTETSCDNQIDDDCDGQTDCDDLLDCNVLGICGGTPGCDFDGICEAEEDCTTCLADCPAGGGPACGNGVCEAGNGEDCLSCPADCNGQQGGNAGKRYCCGDGAGQNPVPCSDPRCTASGRACTTTPAETTCCGDGLCEPGELGCNCGIDCGTPPAAEVAGASCADDLDNDCDGQADCNDADCAADPSCVTTGCDTDGTCEPGENCMNCLPDCPGKLDGPQSKRYCCGNGILEGPEGTGAICDGNP